MDGKAPRKLWPPPHLRGPGPPDYLVLSEEMVQRLKERPEWARLLGKWAREGG